MAKSFLAAQISEIREGLHGLQGDVQQFNAMSRQIANSGIKVASPGGPGGGSGPVILGPNGSPAGSSGSLDRASIANFLAGRNPPSSSSSTGAGGSGSRTMTPTPNEKMIMDTLGEGIEYVKDLISAAGWAGLGLAIILRSSKQDRDALIAAWKESGTMSGGGTGGGGTGGPGRKLYWLNTGNGITVGTTSNPNAPGAGAEVGSTPVSPNDGIFMGGGLQSGAVPIQPGSAADKNPTAGDKFVAEAVGKVGVAIDKLAAKIDTQGGLGFRKMGI